MKPDFNTRFNVNKSDNQNRHDEAAPLKGARSVPHYEGAG